MHLHQEPPGPTVPAATDTAPVDDPWADDPLAVMRRYGERLVKEAEGLEHNAHHFSAAAATKREIARDIGEILERVALPKRTPGAALHEALVDSPPPSVFVPHGTPS